MASEETTGAILRITGQLVELVEASVAEAAAVLRNGRRALRRITDGRVRGRRPVEFGYKPQVVDNDDGVIVDHSVEFGASARHHHRRDPTQTANRRRPEEPSSTTAASGDQ